MNPATRGRAGMDRAAAFEDEDVKPAKKSKTKLSKKPVFDDDEDEDFSASKKKGKKEKAVPATAPAGGGSTIPRVFMFCSAPISSSISAQHRPCARRGPAPASRLWRRGPPAMQRAGENET